MEKYTYHHFVHISIKCVMCIHVATNTRICEHNINDKIETFYIEHGVYIKVFT